jgi:beta-lactamase class A
MNASNLITKLDAAQIEYAFYYSDKQAEPVFAANQHLFRSASIIKIPILLSWLELEKSGLVNKLKLCDLDSELPVGGAGFAEQFTTRQLAFADLLLMMIATSDNFCTNLVINEIGLERLRQVMTTKLGLKNTRCERKLMDYAARERGLDNYIDATECIRFYELIKNLERDDQRWVRSLLLANTDSALLLRSIQRDTLDFYHKTGSMDGVLHDWGFSDQCELFLLTQKVTDEPAVFEIFGEIGRFCLIAES